MITKSKESAQLLIHCCKHVSIDLLENIWIEGIFSTCYMFKVYNYYMPFQLYVQIMAMLVIC